MLWSSHSLKHEWNYVLGMDDPVIALSKRMSRIMAWAWMLWSSHSLKNELNYGLGMDALVIALIKK